MNELPVSIKEIFDEDRLDLLSELVNIGVGRAADSLSQLVESRIQLHAPTVKILGPQDAHTIFVNQSVMEELMVTQSFTGGMDGRVGFLFDVQSAMQLSSLLCGDEYQDDHLGAEQEGVLLEVGNIILNAVMGSLSNEVSTQLKYSIPRIAHANTINRLLAENMMGQPAVLLVDVHLQVENSLIEGSIIMVFSAYEICTVLKQITDQLERRIGA